MAAETLICNISAPRAREVRILPLINKSLLGDLTGDAKNRKSGWTCPLITLQPRHRQGPSIGQRHQRRACLRQQKKKALQEALRLKDWASRVSLLQGSRSASGLQG